MFKTNISQFSVHNKHQKRLAAGLRLDPLEELTALPQIPHADSRGPLCGRGGEKKEREKERGGEEREEGERGRRGSRNFWWGGGMTWTTKK
jgi:hypothetical protein